MGILNFLVTCGWCGSLFVPNRNYLHQRRKGKQVFCSAAHGVRAAHYKRQHSQNQHKKSAA